MIFNLFLIIWYAAASLLGALNSEPLRSEMSLVDQVQAMDTKTTNVASIQDSVISEFFYDLDLDGEDESVWVQTSLGEEIGDESIQIFLDIKSEPDFVLPGYFYSMTTHLLTPQSKIILAVSTMSGHSLETTFFSLQNNQLSVIPVSTARLPAFFGIVSRNQPDFLDVNGDGVLELVTYYRHFPPEKQRTVEVYSFDGEAFIKTHDYEESLPELYL